MSSVLASGAITSEPGVTLARPVVQADAPPRQSSQNLRHDLLLNGLGMVLLTVSLPTFGALAVALHGSQWTPSSRAFGILLASTGPSLVVILHELTHAAAMKFCGLKPIWSGSGSRLCLSLVSAGDPELTRNQWLVVWLAPLAALDAIGLLLLLPAATAAAALLLLTINTAGAAGDLYSVAQLLRSERTAGEAPAERVSRQMVEAHAGG